MFRVSIKQGRIRIQTNRELLIPVKVMTLDGSDSDGNQIMKTSLVKSCNYRMSGVQHVDQQLREIRILCQHCKCSSIHVKCTQNL